MVCLEAEPSPQRSEFGEKYACWTETPENYLETPHAKEGREDKMHTAVLSHTLSTQTTCLFSQCLFGMAGSSLIPPQHLSPPPTVCMIREKTQALSDAVIWPKVEEYHTIKKSQRYDQK